MWMPVVGRGPAAGSQAPCVARPGHPLSPSCVGVQAQLRACGQPPQFHISFTTAFSGTGRGRKRFQIPRVRAVGFDAVLWTRMCGPSSKHSQQLPLPVGDAFLSRFGIARQRVFSGCLSGVV